MGATTTRRISAVLGALVLVLSALAAITAGAAFADDHDEGNGEGEGQPARGSISIDDIPFDEETSNEVKVGCDPFRVDFFGFAEQADVPVTFTLWAPHEEQDLVYETTVDLEDARGNDLSAQLYIGVFDDPLGEALLSYEPAHAEDYDYKLRVEAIIKERGESGVVSKKTMLYIDCPELAAAAAGEIADEGAEGDGAEADADAAEDDGVEADAAVEGDVEAADEDDTPTPVGAVGAGTGPISPASGTSLIILVTLLAGASAGAVLGVRRRTVGG